MLIVGVWRDLVDSLKEIRRTVMAIVRKLEPIQLDRDSKHSEVDCTYSIVEDDKENKYLQIDTY